MLFLITIINAQVFPIYLCIIDLVVPFSWAELLHDIIRSGAESGVSEARDNDDNVELEKSNVLLMGPTGSGMHQTQHA